jgi:hypothetical protein
MFTIGTTTRAHYRQLDLDWELDLGKDPVDDHSLTWLSLDDFLNADLIDPNLLIDL